MKSLIRDIIIAVVVVLAVTWVIKPTIVQMSSMQPTLYQGDYVLVNKQAYTFGEEKRGDIIIFPSEDSEGKKGLFIKRIIGLSGDTITIKDGNVYIDGKEQDQSYTLEKTTVGNIDNLKVPKGKLFVMGDNRRVSEDSRSDRVGCIDKEEVVGKAFVRLYPFNEIGSIY